MVLQKYSKVGGLKKVLDEQQFLRLKCKNQTGLVRSALKQLEDFLAFNIF